MKAGWTLLAQEDVDEYSAYIAQDDLNAAERWFKAAGALADRAARHPQIGRVVPEFEDEDLRELFLYSHRLIYRVKGKQIEVLRVWHTKRLLTEAEVSAE